MKAGGTAITVGPRQPFPILVVVGIVAAVCLARADRALAAWPHSPSGNVLVSLAAANEHNPSIIPDGAGGAFIAWDDTRSSFYPDIYAQRLDASGAASWTAGGVPVCTAAWSQAYTSIVSDGAGGFIATWQDNRGTDADVYAQRIDAAGNSLWTGDGVAICTATGSQLPTAICTDGSGGAIIAWQDARSGNLDIYVQRVDASGTTLWTANGVVLCTASGNQGSAVMVADGAGGAIIAWEDARAGAGNADIYARKVNASGTPQWTSNGVAICTATGNQQYPAITTDGVGGGLIAWQDARSGVDVYGGRVNSTGTAVLGAGVPLSAAAGNQQRPAVASDGVGGMVVAFHDDLSGGLDVYAQRMGGDGSLQWASGGVPVSTAAGSQALPQILSDGAAGFVVSWDDTRSGVGDIYAQRLTSDGATTWASGGVAITKAIGAQYYPKIASDGAGGAILAWMDQRAGGVVDIYAQRVERFGELGNPEPSLLDVRDVPGDQGGRVLLEWTASYLDAFPGLDVAQYSVWRRVPSGAAAAWGTQAASPEGLAAPASPLSGRAPRTTLEAGQALYWEHVADLPARAFPGYSYTAPTTADSVAGSNPLTSFMVMAERAGGSAFWASAPDSGYSVDDLAPAAPAPFSGTYAAGTADLDWEPSAEPDLAGYRLYRGADADFVPGPANLVATLAEPGYSDPAGAPFAYKLTAFDVHGNESPATLLVPSGVTAVSSAGELAFGLSEPAPNPSRRDGATLLRFGLPHPGMVRLAIHDVQGRRVRTIADGRFAPGRHELRFDGLDETGRRLAPGAYLVVLGAEGRQAARRMVLVD